MTRTLVFSLACACVVVGCASNERTRVEVHVEAASGVKAAMTGLRLRAAGAAGSQMLFDDSGQLATQASEQTLSRLDRWPIRVELTPERGEAGRRFSFEAAAIDATGTEIAVGRIHGTYRDGIVSYASIYLADECTGVACPRADTTCQVGTCVDAQAVLLDAPPTLGGPDGGATPCLANQICATVDGAGGPYELLAVMLYSTSFDPEGPSLPTPQVRYLPVVQPVLPIRVVVDLTQPIAGAVPASSYYVGIVGFASDADSVPVPVVDAWALQSTTRFIGAGSTVDLGAVTLTAVPRVDLPGTPGDDRDDRVTCPGASSSNCAPCCRRVNAAGSCDVTDAVSCTGPNGASFLRCDGPEDCSGGEVCCGSPGDDHVCVDAADCNPRARACHGRADCPLADACITSTFDELGHCDADDPATAGDDRAGFRVCGESLTCDLSASFCCSGASFVCLANGQICSPPSYPKVCDGREDCPEGEACCFTGTDSNTCGASNCIYKICHTDEDCFGGTCTGTSASGGGRLCE